MKRRIELIAVGGELLSGRVADTNTAHIARKLGALGLEPEQITVLPDDVAAVTAFLRGAIRRGGVVIVTGGLGSTGDDVTRAAAVAALGGRTETLPEALEAIRLRFASFGRKMPPGYGAMATVPAGALLIPNTVGAAPGLDVAGKGFRLFLLPGPPAEMRPMFRSCVEPALAGLAGPPRTVLRTAGISESALEDRLAAALGRLPGELGVISGERGVDLYLPAGNAELEASIRGLLGDLLYAEGETRLEETIVAALVGRGETLAVAESLTGGLVASAIVSVPGASACFLEGFVTYGDEAKQARLGVRPETIAAHGAVSRPTALEMAAGACRTAGADRAIATTGIAGPTGARLGKPVGLVFVAVDGPSGTRCRRLRFSGDRDLVRRRACAAALDLLRLDLAGAAAGFDEGGEKS
ncbi:MAG: nicotinamide-nucleotide amidohydrolase family protein [Candidatus Krumholzibacteriota bacterium]|nr:nicotinamide-nucleotide amidohydrolase family protein [Candidatus Krumholzibacteriota bacterium]